MKPMKFLLGGFLAAAAVTAIFLAGFRMGQRRASPAGDVPGLGRIASALEDIRGSYVEPVDEDRLVDGALRGMAHTLDAHSAFLDKSDFADLKDNTEGEFEGLGVMVDVRDRVPTVISALDRRVCPWNE